ncbi:MAG: hypothetical protein K0R03_2516 [Moraxellaceae bacterium]|jgi:uncharacterized membrane protein|nr:hypothetical protein [Moraxellaceae bacterium]
MPTLSTARTAAIAFVFIWFLLGGLGHFVAADFFIGIVPPYVPFAAAAVYVSGVLELLGAAGLLLPRWRKPAGIGLFVLTLCVTPANVHMWLHPELFVHLAKGLSLQAFAAVLGFRLVVQVFLLYCIWYGAIREPKPVLQPA